MQSSNLSNSELRQATLGEFSRRAVLGFGAAGVLFLLAATAQGVRQGDHLRHFFHTYLVSFSFIVSLSLGALFFVALQHASRAGWSVTVRRLAEIMASALPGLLLLFLPILIPLLMGNYSLYEWANPQAVAADEILRHKQPYLNPQFFAFRGLAYFAVWGLFAKYFLARSVEQDSSGDARLTLAMERASPVALILFALTVTFAAFDWLMSLTPHWFSTIYGVYFFSGAVVGFLAALILLAIFLQSTGRLATAITAEHYHDLGKLLFAFVFFWGYIAFSQFLLIWYANLPEETVWYQPRSSGAWLNVSLLLVLGNLLIPFAGLLSRHVKRRKGVLGFWAVWLLVMHWIDLYWLVMPKLDPASVPLASVDLLCLAGLTSLYLAMIARAAGQRSLVPLGDPRLPESLRFENV